MIEHVGHEYMDEFFAICESHLAEDGILVLQVSTAGQISLSTPNPIKTLI
jgi:cyclopropane fatty-acyl-phospholipid synthase-like methyltransferase